MLFICKIIHKNSKKSAKCDLGNNLDKRVDLKWNCNNKLSHQKIFHFSYQQNYKKDHECFSHSWKFASMSVENVSESDQD